MRPYPLCHVPHRKRVLIDVGTGALGGVCGVMMRATHLGLQWQELRYA
jgi:hypothetical protein